MGGYGGYVVGWLRRLCGGLVAEAMCWVGCGGFMVGGWLGKLRI